MKKRMYWAALIYLCILGFSIYFYYSQVNEPAAELHQRLLPVEIKAVKSGMGEDEIRKIVLDANQNQDVLSIAGMQHSQGGQTVYPNGIMMDMKSYNSILDFNVEDKTITVQSGATWNDIQQTINPHGLSLKVSQSQNIFTLGGSLSVHAHGLDIRNGGMVDMVHSLRLMNAKGEILNLSPEENSELFYAVIGGYGLFGIILDVTLELTEDELYEVETAEVDFLSYPDYFKKNVLGNEATKMHLARISIAPESFMEEMYVVNYKMAKDQSLLSAHQQLKTESLVAVPKFFLGLSRINDRGKSIFWNTQKSYINRIQGDLMSRNNVMRSDSEFMEYDHAKKTEILQEYFVPMDRFSDYIADLKVVLEDDPEFNLLNVTIRYVEKNEKAVLSYAQEDMLALVLLINLETDPLRVEEAGETIRKMIDVTLDHDGSYYLPYFGFPTKTQMLSAYPRTEEFFDLKEQYDPEHRFMNLFYEEYRP